MSIPDAIRKMFATTPPVRIFSTPFSRKFSAIVTESEALLPPSTATLGVGPELMAFPKKSNSRCMTLPANAGIFSANPTREG